ncbi:Amidase signature enzyme, partial [Rhizoctonia solani]
MHRFKRTFCLFLLLSFLSLLPPATLSFVARSPTAKYPDLYEASIGELQNGLDKGDFTSVDLVKAYFARIDEVNLKGPKLRAVIELNPQAIAQAAALDAERKRTGKRSPLHGIPILLKDNIATLASEGMNTTAGSYALLKSVVPGDATVAAKLRKAGAVLLGKANLSEWANIRGTFISASGWSAVGGQATNPYYPAADPCGSSSGSGVAIAIGLAAGSLGTETDGSIICPSSYNNLVGVKPTVGLTSREGVVPISSHQDTVGPMTRSVADAAVILSIIAGRDKKDNYTQTAPSKIPDYTQFLDVNAIKGKRFGVPRAVFTDDSITGNHPSINVEFNKSLDIIRSLGGTVVDPADLPNAHEIPDSQEFTVLKVDLKVDLNKYLKSLKSIPTKTYTLGKIIQFNDLYKDLEQPKGYEGQTIFIDAEATSGYNSTYYDALRENYKLGRQRGIDGALKSYKLDALLLPSNGTRNSTSFEIHNALNALVLGYTTTPAAIAGYPIVTVPLGFHPDNTHVESAGPYTVFPAPGVPFGLSFLGTAYSEASLIGFAYAYEQRTHTRLKRLAYKDAIPKTQLQDIIL